MINYCLFLGVSTYVMLAMLNGCSFCTGDYIGHCVDLGTN